ncbi:uncharacterized protein MICPUCDRAFT_39106 [Micromonas pusilla CCMP1545]|jgi:hypothetical protein|uniref:Predicted protein n=2 Tax=Micromonas pusilla TaxID=38833 RepID=C1MPG1_MICPC|nr:uncharacterized protein MICPUCDRAFT_39106 [Micromonas pusilla CCMP1545]EEH57903.1 predicted protein [Micromonas pusilla CCMP1545]|tara:strand:+ start:691 stop:1110 length:420 start_codon:yes stop_codon:yes gene_type:complete|eukprot:XP_003057952.1 predicted protein [Micromonas pusilla CCMP1545]
MSSYDKVRGGKFSFKGGGDLSLGGVGKKKKKKKKSKDADALALEAANADGGAGETMQVGQGIGGDPGGDAKGKYEELFPYEAKRQANPTGRKNCWGTNYREAPEILHGYDKAWRGREKQMSVEERLDLRCGHKADKFCK